MTTIRVLCCVLLLAAVAAEGAQPLRGRAKVADGDSLEVQGRKVRLWGIDAPEYRQTCRRDGADWDCGLAARDALRRHLDGRAVHCVPIETDAHGRIVARCSAQGRSVNEWLVREGWALDYRRYSKGAFARAQAQAKAARRGIWSGSFENPERYRRRKR